MFGFVEDSINLKVPREGVIRVTLSELTYFSKVSNTWIIVPVGLETDLGSIPTVLQPIFPKDGRATLAYILHDYLYKIGYKNDRNLCDDILKEAMISLGVGWFKVNSVRVGLKVGGSFAWDNHREDAIIEKSNWN